VYKSRVRSEMVRDVDALAGLAPEWAALWAASATRPVTLHPAWIDAWWATLGGEGELAVVAVRDGDALVGLAPFYLVPPRGGALRARELRLVGDGVVGARRAVLVRAGAEPAVLDEAVAALGHERGWDVLDLTLGDGVEMQELARRFAADGRAVEEEAGATLGRPQAPLDAAGRRWLDERLGEPLESAAPVDERADLRILDGADFAPALDRLLSLLRARRGPTGEAAFLDFVARAAPRLHADGAARLIAAERDGRLAAALLLVDGPRWIELASAGEGAELVRRSLRAAVDAGASTYEFLDDTPLATARARGARLRVWSARPAPAGILQRGASFVRRAGDQLERLRTTAPDVVQRVVAQVATFARLHLYRGELFVRGGAPPTGATLRLFSLAEFDAHPDRAGLIERLGLAEAYCRQKWERGDTVVLAELDGLAAGILWCARVAVYVPDIGREVRPLAGECYIHDVYVAPDARGRKIAPAMLDFLARELRARDVYRAWALIERSNTPSTRAFEKAAYASVADVIYARMGLASKLLVRPPDPEPRAFLGLPPRKPR